MGHPRYEPTLDAPGAGLPWLETFVAKHWWLKRGPKSVSWDESGLRFVREGERILQIARAEPVEQLRVRILIPRILGIEDSSRFWSLAMVMEHLMIVGKGIGDIVADLSDERPPSLRVDIAQVKPPENVDVDTICARFEEFVRTEVAAVDRRVKNRDARHRHAHPWFGELNARQWQWLRTTHQMLHRKQAELISRGLRGENLGVDDE